MIPAIPSSFAVRRPFALIQVNPPVEILEKYGEPAVLAMLKCLERTGVHELTGGDAELAIDLIDALFARAVVTSRFVLADGALRLRLQSQGLSVAGAWLMRRLEQRDH